MFAQQYFRTMVWLYLIDKSEGNFKKVVNAWRIKENLIKPELKLVA